MVADLIKFFDKNYNRFTNNFKMSNCAIIHGHFDPLKTLKPYGLLSSNKKYLINGFHEIGWPEPFPKH